MRRDLPSGIVTFLFTDIEGSTKLLHKKVRLKADPALARPHAAGSRVRLVQPCVHEQFGRLWVAQPRHVAVNLVWARHMRARLRDLDAQVLALEVGDGGGRTVDDPDLIASPYTAGVEAGARR